jgi:hypothetical protein
MCATDVIIIIIMMCSISYALEPDKVSFHGNFSILDS